MRRSRGDQGERTNEFVVNEDEGIDSFLARDVPHLLTLVLLNVKVHELRAPTAAIAVNELLSSLRLVHHVARARRGRVNVNGRHFHKEGRLTTVCSRQG